MIRNPLDSSIAAEPHDAAPTIGGRARTAEEPRESQQFLQSILDALSAHIAILDERGTIIAVNAAWRRFAESNSYTGASWVGVNYLEACDSASGADAATARAVATGIRDVMAGQRDEFSLEYPCHSPAEQHWFIMRVTRFAGDGPVGVMVAHENITKHKRAEEELRHREARLRLLVDQMPAVLWTTDNDLQITSTLGAGLAALVLKPGQIVGLTVFKYEHITDPEFIVHVMHGRALQGQSVTYEMEWMGRSYQSHIEPLRDPDGTIIGTIGVALDFTERKLAEVALRESEERYRSLFNNALDAIVLADDHARYIDANPAACALTGYTREELSRLTLLDVTPAPNRELTLNTWRAFISEGRRSGEFSLLRKDGTTVEVEFRAVANIVPGLHWAVLRDITERKQAEEALRQSEATYRTLIEHLPLVTYMATLDETSSLLYISPQIEAMLGFAQDEWMADPTLWRKQTHPGDRARVLAELARFRASGTPALAEFRIFARDGRVVWVREEAVVVKDEEGRPLFLQGITQDITEHKRAQQALEERARLAELSRDVNIALIQSDTLRGILGRCTEALVRHLGAALARIWTLSHEEQMLELQASAGLYTQIDGAHSRVLVGQLKIGLIAQERQPHLTNAVIGDPRISDQEWARREGMVAFAGYPLLVDDRLVGVMALFARHPLTGAVLQALAMVADGIALGIERKRAEERLRKAEERFRALIEHSSDAITMNSADGTVLYASPPARRILGYSLEELAGGDPFAFVHPDERESARSLLAELLVNPGTTITAQNRVRHKDGSWRWVEATISNLLANPSVGAIVSNYRDITQRKRAEEALRQYTERLKILHEIDQAILTARSPEAIAQSALRHIQGLIGSQRISVTLFDFDAQEVLLIAIDGEGQIRSAPGARYPLKAFADLGDVIATLRQRQIYLVDLMTITRSPPVAQALLDEGLRYYICVPLIVQGQLIGSLQVGTADPPDFDPAHLDILGAAADSVAVAIQQARLYQQVSAGRERLRELSRQLVQAQEIERRQLANALHDQVGQNLTALNINLNILRNQLPPDAAAKVSSRLDESMRMIEEMIEQIRNVMTDLRPAVLDDYGLAAALRWYVQQFAKRTELDVVLQIEDAAALRLPAEEETALFRVAQEALTNVAKHAGAGQATVRLETHDQATRLIVADEGSGFDPMEPPRPGEHRRLGLIGMRERIEAVGGRLRVESAPGRGTRIIAEVSR